nr:oocyte zinc finger protein XlCOF6-like [Leptinotarsa decemlineata]
MGRPAKSVKHLHHPQTKAWECGTCGKKCGSKNLLDEHVNTHLGVRPYVCGICGKNFASKYTYKAHEKTHESRPRPFKCEQCDKAFLNQQNLKQHQRTHIGLKEFSCPLCGKQFGSAHNLEVHSIVHSGNKPFACSICSKEFARKAEVRDHERTHTGERPYQCELCGVTFGQRSNLQSHKRATHYDDKRYQCDLCGKGFKRRRLLDYHIKAVHTGERPFKCEVCDATFVYPEHFKKHRRIHTGEKPFSCEVCGKAFSSRDNRNAHRFIHSDKKPYECMVCGAGFMRKPPLYQHMQSQGHHNDTIVVNQPRLTTDDNQVVTVNSQGEMEIAGETTESQLYVKDEDSKEYVIQIKYHKKYMQVEPCMAQNIKQEGEEVITVQYSDDDNCQMQSEGQGGSGGVVVENLTDNDCQTRNKHESEEVKNEYIDINQLHFENNNDKGEHIIIDGQQMSFVEMASDEDQGEVVAEVEPVAEGLETFDYSEIFTSDVLNGIGTQIIETSEGPIELINVRILSENGEETEAWVKTLPK